MLTIKNWVRSKSALLLAATVLLAGCSPPGPRALLEGKRLLEQGNYPEALEQLKTATVLLATNAPASEYAQAWNYLGVALHHAGQLPAAERAYQRAFALDHNLTEAHFNLGCLWLEQNRIEGAKTEFTTCTLSRGNAPEGFLKLGMAELRASESGSASGRARSLNAAESSIKEALKLRPQNPEALNCLGLVMVARNQPAEAAQAFNSALQQQPHLPAALLNLAILAQRSLKDPQLASKYYREYLSLKPVPANAEAVRLALQQLEQEAAPTRAAAAPPATPPAESPKPQTSNATHLSSLARTEPATPSAKTSLATANSASNNPARSVDQVTLTEDPVLKPAQDVPGGATSQPGPTNTASGSARSTSAPAMEVTRTERRSLFQRIFGSTQSGSARAASAPASSGAAANSAPAVLAKDEDLPAVPALPGARYPYKAVAKPATGNRDEAQRAFTRGLTAQSAGHLSEAIKAYRIAGQLDPSFYTAFYNLGVAAAQAGELRTALLASEQAVAIQPESADARYNFALALKKADYFTDAANELEKLLAYSRSEARAHLALANLYAQQLHQPAKARPHYQRVLELDPHNQTRMGDQIRFWLVENR